MSEGQYEMHVAATAGIHFAVKQLTKVTKSIEKRSLALIFNFVFLRGFFFLFYVDLIFNN